MIRPTAAATALALAACAPGGDSDDGAPTGHANGAAADVAPTASGQSNRPFSRIASEEIVHFTGTEPFWGGHVAFARLTYSTPEHPDGTTIAVDRFAGRGGVSWSGTYQGAPFSLAVTPGKCSDGMSDRRYPYVATLVVAGEQRNGCAWTEADPPRPQPGSQG
jgi:uncharacterized membrane protein